MKLAVPVHRERVSPLFDVAARVRVLESGDLRRAEGGSLLLEGMTPVQRVELLKRVGVQCLICAGISGFCLSLLRGAGIEVLNGVVGEIEDVMEAYRRGSILQEQFRMPGYGGGRRRRMGYRGGMGPRGGGRRGSR